MKKLLTILIIFVVISFFGCATKITPSGQFQIDLADQIEIPIILADFEAIENNSISGDLTEKSGSSCANGICTIY